MSKAIEIEELINRYGSNVPRYTSYPTAVELKPCADLTPVQSVLREVGARDSSVSLYLHLPHCPSLCYFCACNKIISAKRQDRTDYLSLLKQEMQAVVSLTGGNVRAGQLHLGGGSPSYLEPVEFDALIDLVEQHFSFEPDVERSIEVDPRTFSAEKARRYYRRGFTRASLGVQDFTPLVQELVNRIQPYELTRETTAELRAQGFSSLNFDLIYGLPGQTADSFRGTIEKVTELRPDRIALYGYAHVQWKVKVQHVFEKYPLPSPRERAHLFAEALKALEAAGYHYIGLDHFALPDDELSVAQSQGQLRRNFMGYTTVAGAGVLALGLSGISDLGGILFQNAAKLDRYRELLDLGSLPTEKIFVRSTEDLLRSWIIERLMCDGTLDLAMAPLPIADRDLVQRIRSTELPLLREWEQSGLLRLAGDSVEVGPDGRLFLRQIASVFDAYLSQHQSAGSRTFSQGV